MSLRLTSQAAAFVSVQWRRDVTTKLRKHRLSVAALARSIDVSRQYLARVLDGHSDTLPFETYRSVCEAVGLDADRYYIHRRKTSWESSK